MGLKERLFGIIPEEDRRRISPHFDVIGDIAIIALPEDLNGYAPVIAETIKSHRQGIRTVLLKVEKVRGDCRTARYDIISGETTITTHHEYGFSYRLDLGTVFFNPRLASERRRVTSLVQAGERVLVPFCGAGPFVIPAAARGASVMAVEQNPDAYRWLLENMRLNRVPAGSRQSVATHSIPHFCHQSRLTGQSSRHRTGWMRSLVFSHLTSDPGACSIFTRSKTGSRVKRWNEPLKEPATMSLPGRRAEMSPLRWPVGCSILKKQDIRGESRIHPRIRDENG